MGRGKRTRPIFRFDKVRSMTHYQSIIRYYAEYNDNWNSWLQQMRWNRYRLNRLLLGLVLVGCGLAPCSGVAQELSSPAVQDLVAFKMQIEDAWFSYDKSLSQGLLIQARKHIERYPSAWHPHYYAGLINIKLGNIIRATDRDAAYRYYTAALEHVKVAYARSPGVENTIVLADTYGKLASLKTSKMIYFGGKSRSYLIKAFKKNMYSPKNHLLAGIEIMWTPALFGGSKKRARDFLEKALALVPEWQESDRLIVRWATPPEIFAHLAQLEILCDAPDEARDYVDRALQQVSEFDFVLRDIIPQLP